MGKPKPPKKPPKWQEHVDNMSPWFAMALAPTLQPWALIGAGAATVMEARLIGLLEGGRPVFHPIGGMEVAPARGGMVPDGEGSAWARQRDSRRLCGGSR